MVHYSIQFTCGPVSGNGIASRTDTRGFLGAALQVFICVRASHYIFFSSAMRERMTEHRGGDEAQSSSIGHQTNWPSRSAEGINSPETTVATAAVAAATSASGGVWQTVAGAAVTIVRYKKFR